MPASTSEALAKASSSAVDKDSPSSSSSARLRASATTGSASRASRPIRSSSGSRARSTPATSSAKGRTRAADGDHHDHRTAAEPGTVGSGTEPAGVDLDPERAAQAHRRPEQAAPHLLRLGDQRQDHQAGRRARAAPTQQDDPSSSQKEVLPQTPLPGDKGSGRHLHGGLDEEAGQGAAARLEQGQIGLRRNQLREQDRRLLPADRSRTRLPGDARLRARTKSATPSTSSSSSWSPSAIPEQDWHRPKLQ